MTEDDKATASGLPDPDSDAPILPEPEKIEEPSRKLPSKWLMFTILISLILLMYFSIMYKVAKYGH